MARRKKLPWTAPTITLGRLYGFAQVLEKGDDTARFVLYEDRGETACFSSTLLIDWPIWPIHEYRWSDMVGIL